MHVAITGASGFIGSALVHRFALRGDEVTAISRSGGFSAMPGVKALTMPLFASDLAPVIRSSKPDVLIHCVGAPTLYEAQADAPRDFTNTVVTSAEVLATLRMFSPSTLFVLISSASVYGDRGNILLSENLAPEPISVYGYNKWMAELLSQQYSSQFGLSTLVIRPFSVYGEALKKQVIFDVCTKLASHPVELMLRGTGDEVRDFVHIDDLVTGMLRLVDLRYTGVVNLATGIGTSISSLASMIAMQLSPETAITFTGEEVPGNLKSLIGDVDIAERLGIHHNISLTAGLAKVCDAMKIDREKK